MPAELVQVAAQSDLEHLTEPAGGREAQILEKARLHREVALRSRPGDHAFAGAVEERLVPDDRDQSAGAASTEAQD